MSATLARVRAKLIATGKTQDEIAAGSGISQTTISRVIAGHPVAPRITTIEKLETFADSVTKPRRRKQVAEHASA